MWRLRRRWWPWVAVVTVVAVTPGPVAPAAPAVLQVPVPDAVVVPLAPPASIPPDPGASPAPAAPVPVVPIPGTAPGWVNTGQTFTFAADGSLLSPSGSGITINNVSVSGQQLGSVAFNISSGGLTQYASTSGAVTINTITQNGYAAGQLRSVAVNNNGLVVGTFSNGQNLDLASVSLSHFNGTNYLKALDGGAYAATDQSGPAIDGASGTISGSSLEGSNTDIADEFTKLIVTQQAYSANTKVITTANTMVQDLLNVLR